MELDQFGRLLLVMGVGIAVLGGVLLLASRIPFLQNFGNLPGDIRIQSENFNCFAPIVSMLLLSILATIILNVIVRLFSR